MWPFNMATIIMRCLCSQRTVLQKGFPVVTQVTRNVYDKDKGVDRDVIKMLQRDIDLNPSTLMRFWKKIELSGKTDDQKFRPERLKFLGPDLAAAHFIVARDGAVKFVGKESWFRKDKSGTYYIPNRKVDGLYIEAIDASGTELMYVGLDNLVHLEHFVYLSLSKCPFINDWCMSRLHLFKDTLEFLDISGCPEITERGLACLHHLSKLKGLNIAELPKVADKELVTLYLEEMLPNCTIVGVDQACINSPMDTLLEGISHTDGSPNTKKLLETNIEKDNDSFVEKMAVKSSESLEKQKDDIGEKRSSVG